jgi:ABC-type sulfate transport system permease subunit
MEHDFIHATKLTLMLAAITVPLNTLFGTVAAILITRNEFPGKVRSGSSSVHFSSSSQRWLQQHQQ